MDKKIVSGSKRFDELVESFKHDEKQHVDDTVERLLETRFSKYD